jgi:hypothetical protein
MEYMGYVAAAVVAFLAFLVGWFLHRPTPCFQAKKIYVTLENAGGKWTKKVSPDPATIDAGDKIRWHFITPKDVDVTVSDFLDKKTQKPKNPLKNVPSGPIHQAAKDWIEGECKGNEIFDEVPKATEHDGFGRYQDFTYGLTLTVAGEVPIKIDPEIRIREV